jgi:hypothetical protein
MAYYFFAKIGILSPKSWFRGGISVVEEARVIQSVTVHKGDEQQKFAVGEEVNGEVVIEIVDKSTVGTIEFDLLNEDGETIFTIEKLACQVEWKTIAVDGPVEEVSA